MSQPSWKLLATIGDVNPVDHGGMLVYEDTTGVYAPEAVMIRPLDDDDDNDRWIVYRFPLEKCTCVDGVLSDNEHHPEHPAWFAGSLKSVAKSIGATRGDLIEQLCSKNPIERAYSYLAIGEYHGFINLDHEPVTDLDRSEMESRYDAEA
jgi:hypothetical protein